MTQLHFESKELLTEIKRLPEMHHAESIQFKVIAQASNQANLKKASNASSLDSADSAKASTKPAPPMEGKNSAKRSRVTAYASEVLRKAASEVKDPSLQSALLNISKKAH